MAEELVHLEPHQNQLFRIGCQLAGAPEDNLRISLDKLSLHHALKELGLPQPRTISWADWDRNKGHAYPMLAKPRFGKGSRGIVLIKDEADLSSFFNEEKKSDVYGEYLFQEVISGWEAGFDIVNDFSGQFRSVFARRKLRMRNGETDIARTLDPEPYRMMAETISARFRHRGPMDVDAIISNDKAYIIDINMRFGGGYAFSHFAGANLPAAMTAWMLGGQPDPQWLSPVPNITGGRTSSIVQIRESF